MAAAPPSPRPPRAHCDGGDAPISLFLETDLGTRLALLVAPDTTIRGLKPQVNAEHAAAFPDHGPVAVKSFQVRRKGVLYHLSDSMTVMSAFTKINGGCFLYVKMAEAAAATLCREDDGRRSSGSHLGIHVGKRVQELPAMTSEIACDALPQRLEGGDAIAALNDVQAHDALPSSSQLNTEIKKNETGLASDTEAGSDPVIEKAKSHSSQIKHANQTEGAYISSTSISNVGKPSNQSNVSRAGAGDLTKSSRAPLEAGINTSFQQEVQDTSVKRKKKKWKKNKKKCQLTPSIAADQETSEPSAVVKELSISTGDASNVKLTGRDETAVKASGLPLSSSGLHDGNQGGKHVAFMSNAQASTDLISEQGKFDHAFKGCRSPSVRDAIYSAGKIVASEEKTSKGSITPWDGDEKHEQIKRHDEGGHDKGVAEISNTVKDGESTDALEKRLTNDNTSPLKKCKRANKASSVGLASMNTTHEKEMHAYQENAARSGAVSTEREFLFDPSTQQISNNVHQGDSNIIENPNDDGKKKKTRQHSKSSKGVDPSQDLTKSSAFVTNESSMQVTDVAPLDTMQTTPCSIGGTIIDHKKLGENLDIAAKNVIDEVLEDLRSKDSSSMDLDGDMLTGKTHLDSNKNALEHPESRADEVGVSTALPLKYPAAVHSDDPASSPRLKKSKREKLKVLSTMIDSSHHSSGVPEEDANKELNESDSLRFFDKTSDPKDILTGDIIAQAGEKLKATKRGKKKLSLKLASADSGKTLDEQISQVDTLDLKGMNATRANLVRGGSVVEAPLNTTGKVEQKGRSSSKTHTVKIQETNCSTPRLDSQLAKDAQDEYVTHVIGTYNNENAAITPKETPVVQKDEAFKSSGPIAQKARKKSSNSKLQSSDSVLKHGSSADLEQPRSEKGLVSPKSSVVSAEPNSDSVVHPASDAINFLDHFSSSKINDPPISAEHKQNNVDETLREVKNKKKNKRKLSSGSVGPNDVLESLLPTEKTNLTDHFGTSKAVIPSVAAENMNREDENVKNGKDKKRKIKANTETPVAEKENPNCDDQGYIAMLLSAVQNGRMGQDYGKESSSKVTQNDSKVQYEPEVATLEKKSEYSGVDGQNKLLTDKDHVHISEDVRKSASQIKPHAKSKNDESIKRRVAPNPKPVSNLVKDFSMSPQVSGDSTEGTPQNANRYRVAVRKVPSTRYEQTREKSVKENRKVDSAVFNANSKGSDDELDTKDNKAVMEASPVNSSTSADSGISSAASDESDVPDDDDGTVSLSQKRLKEGLHISSILRGTSSYKKARKKQAELLDDDTVVPDSQPADGLWD